MNPPKLCDNKNVGVIIRNNGLFALIKRRNFPIAYAFVAGHLDGDTPEISAKKEAREEVGITVSSLKELFKETLPNPCRRDNGFEHEWTVFEAIEWTGELIASSDAKEAFWANREQLEALAEKTRYFEKKLGIPLTKENLSRFITTVTQDPDWQENPGLEPVWAYMLKKINIV